MTLVLLLVASAAYAVGGLFMKLSDGLAHGWPTAGFLALFAGGALLQARAMAASDLGVSYIFVLGVEVLITVLLSAVYLGEPYTGSRLAAIAMVVVGIAWLRAT